MGGKKKGPQAMAGNYDPDSDPPPKRRGYTPHKNICGAEVMQGKITSGKFESAQNCAPDAVQQLDVTRNCKVYSVAV